MKDNIHDFISRVNKTKNSNYILISWSIDDVRIRELKLTELKRSQLTDQQCRDILKKVYYSYDCCNGITWETFDTFIYDYFKWAIKRPINGIPGNGYEYLLNDNGKVKTFKNIGAAEDFLSENFIPFDEVSIDIYFEGEI